MNALGITLGLATAALWSVTAICFEAATKRLGTLTVNGLRLLIAALLFLGLSMVRTGALLPLNLSFASGRDLVLSGLVGFVLGDLMLFQAFADIGARLSMLVYASVPAMTSIAGALFLDEHLSVRAVFGMAVTVAGIAVSVLARTTDAKRELVSHRLRGIVLALGGSVGQTAGLLLGKRGAAGMDAFAATEVRVLAGLIGFFVVMLACGKIPEVARTLSALARPSLKVTPQARHATRMGLFAMSLGAVLGPFVGVSLGLRSTQLLPAGVAATLMATVPAMLIPISAIAFRERVTLRETLGAVLALGGVAVLAS